jgi:hypothetical protein
MSDRIQASNRLLVLYLRREALIQQLEELQKLRDLVRRAEARLGVPNASAPPRADGRPAAERRMLAA